MLVSSIDISKSMNQIDLNPQSLLSYYEDKIHETEVILADFKRKASFLKNKIRYHSQVEITDLNMKLSGIRWRTAIRECLAVKESHQFYLTNSNYIARCIAWHHSLEIINREIKSKISSTLSLMFREGEIGRFGGENGKNYLYGLKKFFESDMTTLKKMYKSRISELEQFK
jgi:Rps23 Pro-64 3,4-dihydroxylase Tpa1-like proline 4-hydroxylase